MTRHKITGFALAFLFLAWNTAALEVAEDELRSTSGQSIDFINYTGPQARIDSAASILQIGTGLGTVVARNPGAFTTAGNAARYFVVHAVDPSEQEKFDADIIFIGSDASVDHIDNLRRIIVGYLIAAYAYSERDAQTIAVFVTIYNAVYRRRLDTYQEKYKAVVLNYLNATDCGLSVNYQEWPGHSQIVIPLYDPENGGLSTVDTSVISDREVVSRMREDDDRGIDERKDMVDLQEREAAQATERAQEAQQQAVQEEARLNEERQRTQVAQRAAEQARAEADEAQRRAEQSPDDAQARREAEQTARAAEEADARLEEQRATESEQQARTDEAREEAARQQNLADRRTTEAQNARREIARDQREIIDESVANAFIDSVYGITLSAGQANLSRLVKINTQTGAVIQTSPVTVIRGRTIFLAGGNFIAIAGENRGNGTVKLVTISPDTMEIIGESNEVVAEDSVLVEDSGEYYCVVQNAGSWVLAKYASDLRLLLRSSVPLMSNTPVTVSDSYIVVTGENGLPRLLNKRDLSLVAP